MNRKTKTSARIGALICLSFILISFTIPITSSQTFFVKDINGLNVSIDTSEGIELDVNKDGEMLYSIQYKTLEFMADGYSDVFSLEDGEWTVDYQKVPNDKLPHVKISLETPVHIAESQGDLSMSITVLSLDDTSEVTFSYSIKNLEAVPDGRFFVFQELSVNGQIVRTPDEVIPGKSIDYYEFSLINDQTGFYSWSTNSQINGDHSEAIYFQVPNSNMMALGMQYESEASEVSISQVDIDNTRMSAMVPVPKAYDHIPSFAIGLLVSAGFVIGIVAEKRREFYKNRESSKILKLEESPYYKGKE
ncbi:MAG: hypothetical protein R6U61_01610 [Thermoplasmata archaeon]